MSVATRHLLLVNDLRRTRWGYWLARWGSRILTRSQIVHTDGPLSVSAAFTDEETLQLARQSRHRSSDTLATLATEVSLQLETEMIRLPATICLAQASGTSWDAVVAGAGPAGSVAARELASQGPADVAG